MKGGRDLRAQKKAPSRVALRAIPARCLRGLGPMFPVQSADWRGAPDDCVPRIGFG